MHRETLKQNLYTASELIAVRCRLKAAFREGGNAAFRRQMQAPLTLRIVAGLFAAVLVMAGGVATAQPSRDAVASLRSDLKVDRKALIAEQMKFTDQESEAFWPIYRSYRAEVEKVTDGLVELILEYSDLYPNVPEDKAGELLKQYIKAETNLLSVKTKYLKKLGTVLPASKVFRFAQLDYRLDLGIRTGLAASIPLVPQGASASAGEQR